MINYICSHFLILGILLFACSFFVSAITYPIFFRIAKIFNIVDNPNARKLQRHPIPVMGGYSVFCGVVFSLYIASVFIGFSSLTILPILLLTMLVLGGVDDVKPLPPLFRATCEAALVLLLVLGGGMSINDFHGLFGLNILPWQLSIPLSLIAGVGIINSINLIDGVDGFSSGYCIMACSAFLFIYSRTPHLTMMSLSIACIGALIPFYLHNVFGEKSKMFIGDSGTMFMGLVMTVLVFRFLSDDMIYDGGPSPVPFALAILAVPVFDTLRVMSGRLIRHQSPIHPDKTHLHHAFINLGFSHSGTSFIIILLNAILVVILWISYKLGATAELQFLIVLVCAWCITFGLYWFLSWCKIKIDKAENLPICVRVIIITSAFSHMERKGVWGWLRTLVDKKAM